MSKNRCERRRFLVGIAASVAVASNPSALAAADSRSSRKVAITIDDGPASGAGDDLEAFTRISKGIREAFAAHQVPAMMFINERQLGVHGQRDQRAAVLQAWLDAGLQLGNHTYSHLRLSGAPLSEFFDDIIHGEVVSKQLLHRRGEKLTWFRYPYLSTDQGKRAEAVENFLRERDYRIAPVTVDYKDFSFASNFIRFLRAGEAGQADEYYQMVLRALDIAFERSEKLSTELLGYELPQILLIHCNEMNSVKLPETLDRIRDRGYEFISLEQAMRDPAYNQYEVPPGVMGSMYLSGLARLLGS